MLLLQIICHYKNRTIWILCLCPNNYINFQRLVYFGYMFRWLVAYWSRCTGVHKRTLSPAQLLTDHRPGKTCVHLLKIERKASEMIGSLLWNHWFWITLFTGNGQYLGKNQPSLNWSIFYLQEKKLDLKSVFIFFNFS